MLGVVCSMKELKRTKQGIFDIKDAYNLEDINYDTRLLSISDALINYDRLIIGEDIAKKVSNGMILDLPTNSDMILILNKENKLLAIYKRYDKDPSKMKPYRVFKEEL